MSAPVIASGEDLYLCLAHERPNEVALGGAFITLVEPHVGHELAYNRWYEDDHLYAGATSGPWCFSARRFVAPARLRSLRIASTSALAAPIDAGCYVAVYWLMAGHVTEFMSWALELSAKCLFPAGRGFAERTHVYTALHDFRFAAVDDRGPMRAEHALDYPFKGMVLEIFDADSGDESQLGEWLAREFLPVRASHADVGPCVAFSPLSFGTGMLPQAKHGGRICLLSFLDRDPEELWARLFATAGDAVANSGRGALVFSGGFIPTVPGTDRYVSELRDDAA